MLLLLLFRYITVCCLFVKQLASAQRNPTQRSAISTHEVTYYTASASAAATHIPLVPLACAHMQFPQAQGGSHAERGCMHASTNQMALGPWSVRPPLIQGRRACGFNQGVKCGDA
jgi:hypothetical protein